MNTASQSNLGLRPYLPDDAPLLAEIFRASVEELTGDDYDPASRAPGRRWPMTRRGLPRSSAAR